MGARLRRAAATRTSARSSRTPSTGPPSATRSSPRRTARPSPLTPRHLVSLSAADMKKLRSVVIDHDPRPPEDLGRSQLHLLGAADRLRRRRRRRRRRQRGRRRRVRARPPGVGRRGRGRRRRKSPSAVADGGDFCTLIRNCCVVYPREHAREAASVVHLRFWRSRPRVRRVASAIAGAGAASVAIAGAKARRTNSRPASPPRPRMPRHRPSRVRIRRRRRWCRAPPRSTRATRRGALAVDGSPHSWPAKDSTGASPTR